VSRGQRRRQRGSRVWVELIDMGMMLFVSESEMGVGTYIFWY